MIRTTNRQAETHNTNGQLNTPDATPTPKNEIILLLRVLHYDKDVSKYTTVPKEELLSIARTAKFQDNSANSLTKAIIKTIDLLGGFATRQSSQGQYNSKLGTYTKGTTKKGVADVGAVLNGKSLSIEVKYGRDTQKQAQKNVQNKVTAAGGFYYIAKNLPDTFNWIITVCGISPDYIKELIARGKELFSKPKHT